MRKTLASALRKLAGWLAGLALRLDPLPPASPVTIKGGGGPGEEGKNG